MINIIHDQINNLNIVLRVLPRPSPNDHYFRSKVPNTSWRGGGLADSKRDLKYINPRLENLLLCLVNSCHPNLTN